MQGEEGETRHLAFFVFLSGLFEADFVLFHIEAFGLHKQVQ
jgi:hypothetical protein